MEDNQYQGMPENPQFDPEPEDPGKDTREDTQESARIPKQVYTDPNAGEEPRPQPQHVYTVPGSEENAWQTGSGSGSNESLNQQYQNNFDYNVNTGRTYTKNPEGGMDTTPLSMGEWVLILLIMSIPCVNIIFCLVWAFGKEENLNRRNFCRAQLIFIAIGIVLTFILFAFILLLVGVGGLTYYY